MYVCACACSDQTALILDYVVETDVDLMSMCTNTYLPFASRADFYDTQLNRPQHKLAPPQHIKANPPPPLTESAGG